MEHKTLNFFILNHKNYSKTEHGFLTLALYHIESPPIVSLALYHIESPTSH